MTVGLLATVLYPNEKGEYVIEDDYSDEEDALCGNPWSRKVALLCSRKNYHNFKEVTGAHEATKGHPYEGCITNRWGVCNVTWYTVQELHAFISGYPESHDILGTAFVDEVYRILAEQPEAIIQFACDN